MPAAMDAHHAIYTTHSFVTDPGPHVDLLAGLPADIPGLCRVVQGVVIHLNMGKLYGYEVPVARRAEANTREVAAMLARIRELDPRPLAAARPPEGRFVGHCRVTSVLLCSLLRHQGYAARVRAGFSAYYPGLHGDHWVCEVWQPETDRWALVDGGLDEVLDGVMHVDFEPADVPRTEFLTASRSWQLCRREGIDPSTFGFGPDDKGLGCVRGQLLCDLAAMHKWEPQAIDRWGRGPEPEIDLSFAGRTDEALLDSVADLMEAGDTAAEELAWLYFDNAELRSI